jgi:cytosine/adenosine deaminase-related metal-dependent hydrolase
MRIFTAKYLLPIKSDPIENGAVAVEGATIEDTGLLSDLTKKYPEADVDDVGNAAILPGFVNCHSHLEVTALRGALDSVENDFYTWLIILTKLRGEILNDDEIEVAAIAGAVEGLRAGVTCFGDIGRFGRAGFNALKTAGLRGVLFQETDFSADSRTAEVDFEKLRSKFENLAAEATDLVQVGISPHAPYTVSRKLFEHIARFAIDQKIKTSIHAAESQEEDDLLRNGSGFFTTVYEKFGVEWMSPRCSSIEYLEQTGILETRPLLAHCINVTDQDIEIIRKSGSSIAHCPKSNAKFGHGYAPFEKFLDSNIAVGLGSDSVASNNTCDILEEARFAAFAARNRSDRSGFISAKDVLKASTIGGATALGLNEKIGSLEKGKQADLVVIRLDRLAQQPVTDVEAALVFSSGAHDVLRTIVAGREVYSDGQCTTVDEKGLLPRLQAIADKIGNASV